MSIISEAELRMDYDKVLDATFKNGVIKNIEEVCRQSEEFEACMMAMNKAGIPECDDDGIIYSIWGRALWMLNN